MMNHDQSPNPTNGITDLVTVDALNRAHRPNGQNMKINERDLIISHQDQIRNGLDEYEAHKQHLASHEAVSEQVTDEPNLLRPSVERLKSVQAGPVKTMISGLFAGEHKDGVRVAKDGTVSRPVDAVKRAFGRVGKRMSELRGEAYLLASGGAPERTPSEGSDGRTNRNKRLVAAGAALGITALAIFAFHSDSASHLSTLNEALPKGPKTHSEGLGSLLTAHLGVVSGAQEHVNHVNDAVTLRSGDNPWSVAQYVLGRHASVSQVDQVKDAILQNNHLTEAQAYHLPVNLQLKLPTELIEQIRKANGS